MSLLRKFMGEAAIYGLSSILGRVLNWIVLTPYITNHPHFADTGEFGFYTELYIYSAIAMIFFTYRLETTYFRFATREPNTPREAVFSTASWGVLGATLLFTVAIILFASPIASAMHHPGMQKLVWLMVIFTAFDALCAIPFAGLRLAQRPLRFATIRLVNVGLNIFLVLLLLQWIPAGYAQQGSSMPGAWLYIENGVEGLLWANLITSTVTLLMLLPLMRPMLTHRPDIGLWKKMRSYALPLVPSSLAGLLAAQMGTLVLKYFYSGDPEYNEQVAGIFSAAIKLAVLMNLFVQAFNYAAEPFFFNQSGKDNAKKTYAQIADLFALVGCLAFVGIMVYLDVIQYFLGKNYREGLVVLPIALLANWFLGLYFNFSVWYKLTDKTHYGAIISVSATVLGVGFSIITLPWLGIYAPAWGMLICYASMAIASFLLGQKHYPIPYPLHRIILYLGVALTIFGAYKLAYPHLPDSLWVKLLVSTLCMGIAAAGMGGKRALAWVAQQQKRKRRSQP